MHATIAHAMCTCTGASGSAPLLWFAAILACVPRVGTNETGTPHTRRVIVPVAALDRCGTAGLCPRHIWDRTREPEGGQKRHCWIALDICHCVALFGRSPRASRARLMGETWSKRYGVDSHEGVRKPRHQECSGSWEQGGSTRRSGQRTHIGRPARDGAFLFETAHSNHDTLAVDG